MKFREFKAYIENYPFFRSSILTHLTDNVNQLRRQINEWKEKGYILELKRGMYTLAEKERRQNFSRYFLANQLYQPSYISLETALSFYGLIPERVMVLTSVSSKKTQMFTNAFGTFSYQHIKPAYYDHFIEKHDEFNNAFLIATKERALIDYFYLKMHDVHTLKEDVFEKSLRLQNIELLDRQKLQEIAERFNSKKIFYLLNLLSKYMETDHD